VSKTDRRRSIGLRLSLATAALVAAVAGLAMGTLVLWTGEQLEDQADDALELELEELERRYDGSGHEALAAEVSRRSVGPGRVHAVYVFAESRTQVIAGNLAGWPEALEAESPTRSLSWVEGSGELRVERHVRVASLALDDRRQLLVGRDVTEQRGFQRVLGVAAAGAFALSLLLAIAGGLAIGRSLLGRVEGMNRTILRILDGGGEQRVPVEVRDEFGDLAHHFNRLLDEKQALVTRMREVTDDIAHDLRTPLSRMRTHIEGALAAPADEERAREALYKLLSETDGVLETFNALLRIAQIESGTMRELMERVDLEAVVGDAVDLYRPVAEEAGIELQARIEPGVSVLGDRHLLAQAVLNLIDNALKHGSGGGSVSVSARRVERATELSVRDRGAGIGSQDRERVLQRFVRLDASRSLPGTGLGLSFVAAVAEQHGASLRLEDAAPGLRVTLRFEPPAAAPRS
jgi:signal transduction histidine kinase